MGSIKDNIERINEQVANACREAGRDPSEVTILAAAKYTDRAGVEEILAAGINLIGENRVQDALAKLGEPDIHKTFPSAALHFIGHLQKNKINHALSLFDLIETVDRISLADHLEKRLIEPNRILPILVEAKLTDEESKTGCSESDLDDLLTHIWSNCPHLELRGFMGMGPWDPDPEVARPFYRKLKEFFDKLSPSAPDPAIFRTISMGMSADFHIAIQEGATVVRIGRAIFD